VECWAKKSGMFAEGKGREGGAYVGVSEKESYNTTLQLQHTATQCNTLHGRMQGQAWIACMQGQDWYMTG